MYTTQLTPKSEELNPRVIVQAIVFTHVVTHLHMSVVCCNYNLSFGMMIKFNFSFMISHFMVMSALKKSRKKRGGWLFLDFNAFNVFVSNECTYIYLVMHGSYSATFFVWLTFSFRSWIERRHRNVMVMFL